jgi:hypothetical protein
MVAVGQHAEGMDFGTDPRCNSVHAGGSRTPGASRKLLDFLTFASRPVPEPGPGPFQVFTLCPSQGVRA